VQHSVVLQQVPSVPLQQLVPQQVFCDELLQQEVLVQQAVDFVWSMGFVFQMFIKLITPYRRWRIKKDAAKNQQLQFCLL
jgi:hypothetical protein